MRRLLLLLLLAGCATTGSPRPDRCSGGALKLDDVLARCLVEGLEAPEKVAPADALQLTVGLRGGVVGEDVWVDARVVNVSGEEVEVDVVTREIQPDPHPVVLGTDGFRVGNQTDPSCDQWNAEGSGGLGARDYGKNAVARVRLGPGGSIAASRSVAARHGLCVCAPNEAGQLDIRCTAGRGGPLPAGSYGIAVSMPLAITRDDGAGAYTYPYLRAPVTLTDPPADPWPDEE